MKCFFRGAILCLLTASLVSCGKKNAGLTAASLANPQDATFGMLCIDTPLGDPARKVDPWSGKPTTYSPDLPASFPLTRFPLDVQSCPGFNGAPEFPGGTMPSLIARADCNAGLVHFLTDDWQVFEVGRVSPTGEFDVKVLYITRLAQDVDGTPDCWRRFLGHIKGNLQCPANSPKAASINYTVTWTVDETPPEIMEPASPGQADHRNGKFCHMNPGNCHFTNSVQMGCSG